MSCRWIFATCSLKQWVFFIVNACSSCCGTNVICSLSSKLQSCLLSESMLKKLLFSPLPSLIQVLYDVSIKYYSYHNNHCSNHIDACNNNWWWNDRWNLFVLQCVSFVRFATQYSVLYHESFPYIHLNKWLTTIRYVWTLWYLMMFFALTSYWKPRHNRSTLRTCLLARLPIVLQLNRFSSFSSRHYWNKHST